MPSQARSRLNHAQPKMADGRSPYRDNFIATFSEDGRTRMLSASLLPSLPSSPLDPPKTKPTTSQFPLFTALRPSFLSNQRSLPPSLAPSDGMNVEGEEGRGNNGFVKFLRDKIRSYHIGWGAPAVVRGRRKRGEGGRVPDRNGPYNSGSFERKRSSKSRQS